MARHYYDATGILYLDRITPVIDALFGEHHLIDRASDLGKAYISLGTHFGHPLWYKILPRLSNLAAMRGVALAPEPERTIASVVGALATHFGTRDDKALVDLLKICLFSGPADVKDLFVLAQHFDDGHHLRIVKHQGSLSCDEPVPLAFGGDASFLSREICLFGDSHDVVQLAEAIRTALRSHKPIAVAKCIADPAWYILNSIKNEELRPVVAIHLAKQILQAAVREDKSG